MEYLHQPGDIIAKRYRILGQLGQGGIGVTYAAQELQGNHQVALKSLSLWRMKDFKVMELFEREARILKQLQHPNIPRYLDYFEVDEPDNRYFYLAQELVEGRSLATLIEADSCPDEAMVSAIAAQILEILIYLQQLAPPVLHRDIKPQNIIQRSDGQLFLVDFGAVQDTYQNTLTGGSTVVGTYGYIAPEQFSGQATLATDLYSLGATLLFLLSRKDPAELPQRKLKIDFRPHIQVSPAFADWLDHLLDPIAEDRFQSAKETLAVLRGEQVYTKSAYQASRLPTKSSISLKQNGSKLTVEIPPVWLRSSISRNLALIPIAVSGFTLLLLLILLVLTLGTLKGVDPFPWLIFGSFVVADVLVVRKFLLSAAVTHRIEIDPDRITIKRSLFGIPIQRIQGKIRGKGAHVKYLDQELISLMLNREEVITVCKIRLNGQVYFFGTFLAESEKTWLLAELRSFLKTLSD